VAGVSPRCGSCHSRFDDGGKDAKTPETACAWWLLPRHPSWQPSGKYFCHGAGPRRTRGDRCGGARTIQCSPTKRFRPRSPLSLEQLAQDVCRSRCVSIEQLRSASRGLLLTAARVEIAHRALEGRVASLSQVADFLGRNRSSLSELLSRHKLLSEHANAGT